MKHIQIRINEELNNILEVYIKREGKTKQEFIRTCIENEIAGEKTISPMEKNKVDLERIQKKLNLLLENQVAINDLLAKVIENQNER